VSLFGHGDPFDHLSDPTMLGLAGRAPPRASRSAVCSRERTWCVGRYQTRLSFRPPLIRDDTHFQSSLNMPGFSVSLFLLPREGESKYSSAELLELLDAPADAPGWAWTSRAKPRPYKSTSSKSTAVDEAHSNNSGKAVEPTSGKAFISAIQQACKDVIEAEPEITRYDTYVSSALLQLSCRS
jgi:hypothetical protein